MGSLQEASMSFSSVPSKAEVMGWNSQNLADYMRKLRLTGCNKVVMRGGITGIEFMQMTECELQVFPSCFLPIITKIQSDINKGEQKKSSGRKLLAKKFLKQDVVQEQEVWSSDEFENDSDYEVVNQEEGDEDYVCSLNEEQEDEENDEDYRMPSFEDTVKPPVLRKTKPMDHHHRDRDDDPCSERPSRAPHLPPPRMNSGLPPRPSKESAVPSLQKKKPEKPGTSQKDSKGSSVKTSSSFRNMISSKSSKSTDLANRSSKLTPAPTLKTRPDVAAKPIPGPRAVTNKTTSFKQVGTGATKDWESLNVQKMPVRNIPQGLDPCWYGGQMTRHQAEVALREMNKDGAFVVRDSSKGSAEHQYTLMLLKHGKVYNIKIRKEGNSYYLGTGLTKSFPGVNEMITHHTHNPLLLIDAMDQSSEAQNKCCLLHPAVL